MENHLLHKLRKLGIFLSISNEKLKIDAPKGSLTKELITEIKENKEVLLTFLYSNESIPKAQVQSNYPLTPTQEFMWFTHTYLGGDKAYNVPAVLQLNGKLDISILTLAFQKVLERHESLRTIFKGKEKDSVRQYILAKEAINFVINEVSLDGATEDVIHAEIKANYQKTFQLDKGLLVRASILKIDKEKYLLLFTLHHIISDGWSIEVLTKEVMFFYNSLMEKSELVLPELTIQYKDYSVWLVDKLKTNEYKQKLAYWKSIFSGALPKLELPSFKTRPVVKTYNGNTLIRVFSASFLDQLKDFSKENKSTLFTLLFGSINGLFYRYTGESDIILGTTNAGRSSDDLSTQIGLYSNALAIRTRFRGTDSFKDLLEKQQEVLLTGYDNQEYPFTALVEELSLEKDKSRSPLFDIMVLLQNQNTTKINDEKGLVDVDISDYKGINRKVSQHDITFSFVEITDGLQLRVEYNTDIYQEKFIQSLIKHLECFMHSGVTNPTHAINELSYLSLIEKEVLLETFNNTAVVYPKSENILSLLVEQVKQNPTATALKCNEVTLTYQELENYTNQLAHYLEANYKITKGDFIGIELPRSEWMILSIIAVLKVGGVYVPVDDSYPEERKKYIYTDSGSKIVITTDFITRFIKKREEHPSSYTSLVTIEDLAYTIYTSGTTGKPKGVPISHRSLVDYVKTFINYFQLTNSDKFIQQASISFDTSIEEIFPVLSSGGILVIQKERTDLPSLLASCATYGITVLSTNPYVLEYLNEHYDVKDYSFRALISGGDVLKSEYLTNLLNKVPVYNTYGPTESTICSSYYQVKKGDKNIPIGKPIANRQLYILSLEGLNLVPIGAVGEICISGTGISSGYLNRKELTEEKFIKHPFISGEFLYKTGDLGRWLPDGNVEFIGRKDTQVKIRGYRIELGEIESLLHKVSTIDQVVVTVKVVLGEQALVVYFVSEEEIVKEELRLSLHQYLPDYMVPNYYVQVKNIPLTSNGKVDRDGLPEVSESDLIKQTYKVPSTVTEIALVTIWQEILGVTGIGVTDNFFDLGGQSLKVIQLINSIKLQLGAQVHVKDVFNFPTILEIIPKLSSSAYVAIPQADFQENYPLTASQKSLWVLSQFDGASKAYNITGSFELSGVLDIDRLEIAFNTVIERHESLRTVFKENADGIVRQFILPMEDVDFKLLVTDIITDDTDKEHQIESIIKREYNTEFNLRKGPLLCAKVVKISKGKCLLLSVIHHIIGDGWSMEVLTKDVMTIYNSLIKDNVNRLAELPIQNKDYAVWLTGDVGKEQLNKQQAYWLNKFSGDIPVLNLPSEKARPFIKTYNGKAITHEFSNKLVQQLKAYTEAQKATLFMSLMAGVNGLFYRYTNSNDIVLGIPVAGREHPDLEYQVGLYLNTLAIRTTFNGNMSYSDLVALQKEELLNAYSNQNYPFDELVSQLKLKMDTSRSALFDVMVILQNQESLSINSEYGFEGIEIKPYNSLDRSVSQYDMTFSFTEREDGLQLRLDFNTDIYSEKEASQLIEHLEQFISKGIENTRVSLANLDYFNPSEEKEKIDSYNEFEKTTSPEETILSLFKKQIEKQPNAVALVFKNKKFTFRSLDEQSSQLAHYLLDKFSVEVEDLISIKLERSEWFVISVLAVLKAGAAYVPIDPNYPEQRISYIEKDSQCKVTIDEVFLKSCTNAEAYPITLPLIKVKPNNLAYVIYTSGSTGNPKGVMIEHSNVVSFFENFASHFLSPMYQRVGATTNFTFDISVLELLGNLCEGKEIYLFDQLEVSDPDQLIEKVIQDKLDFLQLTPSRLRQAMEVSTKFLGQLKVMLIGGEELKKELKERVLAENKDIKLINVYGPTETTVWSSCSLQKQGKEVTIGKALKEEQLYILSDNLRIQPYGVIGELCISGAGVARGYHNRPDLTAEKFISHPFINGEKLYKTGDLVKKLYNENIAFIGRKDKQVKLRGYRIELGEIEQILLKESCVQEVVVEVKSIQEEQVLVAYIVSDQELDKQKLRDTLQRKLPEYMLPNYFVALKGIPLTSSGKLDRLSLPTVGDKDIIKKTYVGPRNEIEETLVSLWQEVLGIEKIGVTDNFFELGGHSLSGTRLLGLIHRELNVKISINMLFENMVLEEQSTLIESIQIINKNTISEENEGVFENFTI